MPAVIGTSPQPWKLGLRSAPKTPRGHGKCPSTLFKEFWHSQGHILPWPGHDGHIVRAAVGLPRGVRYPRPWLLCDCRLGCR